MIFQAKLTTNIRYDLALKHVNGDPRPFTRMTNKLLFCLAAEASEAYKYAVKTVSVYESHIFMRWLDRKQKLHAKVQCTKDLSTNDGLICLDNLIRELPTYCDRKTGAMIYCESY
ncbi:hypothetical protein PRUPE_1G082100 [Prunus persica]|uniref:Uncharacterized protein n=1 Tax=Prunus persica TaxID=3760 RepID=M5XHH5_PRUPE|nr:hypothetical protein PRUPE_1G082100 [Prunus persica]